MMGSLKIENCSNSTHEYIFTRTHTSHTHTYRYIHTRIYIYTYTYRHIHIYCLLDIFYTQHLHAHFYHPPVPGFRTATLHTQAKRHLSKMLSLCAKYTVLARNHVEERLATAEVNCVKDYTYIHTSVGVYMYIISLR